MAVLIFIGHQMIARFYTDDVEVAAVAAGLLQLAALFQISDGLQVGALGALRGLKDTRVPMLIVVIAYWLIAFPLAWQLGIRQGLGPAGPWIGLIAGLTVAAVLLNARFWRLSARLE
jgi:MATE family multidrug resistance protein